MPNNANSNKKQNATVRYLKEDLELLIQRLRNLQKQRQNGNSSNLEQFIKLVEEFNDKTTQQIVSINVINTNETVNGQDTQLQLRQLQSFMKQNCSQLSNFNKIIDSNGTKLLDLNLSQLSKFFNEFMHILDRLNSQNSLSILKN